MSNEDYSLDQVAHYARTCTCKSIEHLIEAVNVSKISDADLKRVLVEILEEFRGKKPVRHAATRLYEIGERLRRELGDG
jgi:hypothetical protein